MGRVSHGSATTTEVVCRAIQHSKESLRALARRHGVNQKTIAKWRKRSSTADLRTGPKEPRSTTLPFVSSNDITACSILDTGTGTISSYAFDTRYPARDPIKFDEFTLI